MDEMISVIASAVTLEGGGIADDTLWNVDK